MVGQGRSHSYDVRNAVSRLSRWAARFAVREREFQIAAILVISCFAPTPAFACTDLPAGTSMWVRLSQPVSSHSAKPGTPVHGLLLESPVCDGTPLLPINVPVEGQVVSVRRVGL